jgi:hypothetical protein
MESVHGHILDALSFENNSNFEGHFSLKYARVAVKISIETRRARGLSKKTGSRTYCAGLYLKVAPDFESS